MGMGSHSPKAFVGGAPPEPKVRHPPRKNIIEKRIKTEFPLALLGLFSENTLPSAPKIQIPSLLPARSLPPRGHRRARGNGGIPPPPNRKGSGENQAGGPGANGIGGPRRRKIGRIGGPN